MFRVRVKAFKVVLGTIKEETNLNLGGTVTSSYTQSTVMGRYILGIRVRFSLWERERQSKCIVYCLNEEGEYSEVMQHATSNQGPLTKYKRMKLLIVFFISGSATCHYGSPGASVLPWQLGSVVLLIAFTVPF